MAARGRSWVVAAEGVGIVPVSVLVVPTPAVIRAGRRLLVVSVVVRLLIVPLLACLLLLVAIVVLRILRPEYRRDR